MIFNMAMKNYMDTIESVTPQAEYPIWCKVNPTGQPYWGIGNKTVNTELDLTVFEWDNNEIYISKPQDISSMLKHGLGITAAWKKQLETEYPDTAFDILLSVDKGDKEITPSVTMRFWAVRNREHYIMPAISTLEAFSQPVLMEQVNYVLE